jgi:type IV secretion system protein VirB3
VFGRNFGCRNRLWSSTDRYLDSWDVRGIAMRTRNRGLVRELVFVGATRPPMRWGVTYAALLCNLIFTLEAFLLTRNLLTLLLFAPIHGVSVLLCARDARFFDLLLLCGRTRLAALLSSWRYWHASSFSPLSMDLPGRGGRRPRSQVVVRVWAPHEDSLCPR